MRNWAFSLIGDSSYLKLNVRSAEELAAVNDVKIVGEQIAAEADRLEVPASAAATAEATAHRHLADDKRHGGVGFFNNRASQRPHRPPVTPNGPQQQLAVDKRAGGVGFLNNLLSRFRRPPARSAIP